MERFSQVEIDDRELWEISRDIRIGFAKTFVKYLTVEGHERIMLEMAYKIDDIQEWARERIDTILAMAEMEMSL